MKKLIPGGWLLLAILSGSACTSDKAALESRGSTERLTTEAGRPKTPSVSAYSSVPDPAVARRTDTPAAPIVLPGKVAAKAPAKAAKPAVAKPAPAVARVVRPVKARPLTRGVTSTPAPARPIASAPTPAQVAARARVRASARTVVRRPPTVGNATAAVRPPRPAPRPPAPSAPPRALPQALPAPTRPVAARRAPVRRAAVVSAPKTAPAVTASSRPAAAPPAQAQATGLPASAMFRPDSSVVRARAPWAQLARASAPAMQVFTVNPRRDTVLRATGGTLVRITAGAFALAADTTTPVPGPVELHLRELTTLADIMLANITTRAATGNLLETGGALWVTATAGGRACVLRSGRDLHLALPVRGPRRQAMRAFTADSTSLAPDGLRWRPTPGPEPLEVVRAMPPQYVPGVALLETALRERMGFSPALAQQLLERMPLADRRALRKEWSESGRVLRYTKTLKQGLDVLSISFDVAEDGTASNWGTATGYHSILFNALQQVAPALPGAWRAGTCAARATAMHARLQVLCFDDGTIDVEVRNDPDDWTPCEDPARARLLVESEVGRSTSGPADAEASALAARARPIATDLLGSRYLLDAARLGWVTCYRPTDTNGAKVNYSLSAGAPDADVRLVFQKARVVVGSTMRGGEAQFTNVPAKEPVTVVALRYDPQGQPQLAIQPAIIGEPLPSALQYKPVSVAELRSALSLLEPAQ